MGSRALPTRKSTRARLATRRLVGDERRHFFGSFRNRKITRPLEKAVINAIGIASIPLVKYIL